MSICHMNLVFSKTDKAAHNRAMVTWTGLSPSTTFAPICNPGVGSHPHFKYDLFLMLLQINAKQTPADACA